MNSVILLAGGMGKRMNSTVSKQFLKLGGMPILSYSLQEFDKHKGIDEIVVVIRAEDRGLLEDQVISRLVLKKRIIIVEGGCERHDSVKEGLKVISHKSELVLIHDGVRPFIDPAIIDRNIEGAKEHGACITGVRSKDTVKIASEDSTIERTPPRDRVYIAQTPQTFKVEVIKDAFDKNKLASSHITDDSMVVENAGYRVKVVEGSYENIKITTAEDIVIGNQIAKGRLR